MDQQQLQNQINDLNNQLQQKQSEVSSLNSTLSSERNNHNSQTQNLQSQISEANNTLNTERNSFSDQRNNFSVQLQQQQTSSTETLNNERNSFSTERVNFTNDIQNLNNQIKNLTTNIQTKDSDIAKIKLESEETSKKLHQESKSIVKQLSSEYVEYSEKIEKDLKIWLIAVAVTFLAIIGWSFNTYLDLSQKIGTLKINTEVTKIIDVSTSASYSWFSMVPGIVIELLLVSLLWFVINQYSYQRKLLTEYRNRKVVSSSYLGVLNNIVDVVTRDKASAVVVDTLFSRTSVEMGNELPIKEAVKFVDSLIKK